MHLHGFQFRVLERETSPEQLAPLVVDERGRLATDLGWKDTVLRLAGRVGEDRDRLPPSLSPASRSISSIATISSTRTAE